jgi:hypothetical protein
VRAGRSFGTAYTEKVVIEGDVTCTELSDEWRLVMVKIVDEAEEFFEREVFVDVFEAGVSWWGFPAAFPLFVEHCKVFLSKGRNADG